MLYLNLYSKAVMKSVQTINT